MGVRGTPEQNELFSLQTPDVGRGDVRPLLTAAPRAVCFPLRRARGIPGAPGARPRPFARRALRAGSRLALRPLLFCFSLWMVNFTK